MICQQRDKLKRVWALFETDEVGKPQKKIAGSNEIWFDEEPDWKGLHRDSNKMDLDDTNKMSKSCFQIRFMLRDWDLSDLIQSKWQHDATLQQASEECIWSAMENVPHGKLPKEIEDSSCSMPCSKVERPEKDQGLTIVRSENGECATMKEAKHASLQPGEKANEDANKEQDIVLSSYRLHVENPDDDGFGMSFAAPLILSKTLLEQKLNCSGRDLQNVSFLNLNHEGLSSLGESVLNHWCPKMRIYTADMNRLNNLQNAFAGYEETLEQLSLKDNFLCDLNGLECLHKLQVMHLDGNYLLHVCASALNLLDKSLDEEASRKNFNKNTVLQNKEQILPPISMGSARRLPLLCWRSLREFGASCNRISKVERLGLLCPNLEVLDLGSNNLVSLGCSQESALFGLRCLRVLDVGQNRLTGSSLWDNLRHCPLLLSLVASRNGLEDLPTHDGSVFLRELWLNGNSIRCFSCTAWLPNLQRLYLQDNEIDTLMPIWGFPALEVLDLSFNKISQVHQLRQLGCFSNLRSLQLNDNPVAELPDYTLKVLEAVPWLVELDNEPLTDFSRLQAVKNIFSNVASTAGLWYVRSKIFQGKVPCPVTVDVQNQEQMSYDRNTILVNSIMAGEADLNILWALLLDMSHMYVSTCFGKGQSYLSPFPNECQWRFQSFRLMCLDQKRRLFNSLRESARLKRGRGDSLGNASEGTHSYTENNGVPLAEQYIAGGMCSKNSYVVDLERCLWEHIQFSGNCYEGVIALNEDYKLEMELHNKRVLKVQALVKGFLVRKQVVAVRKQICSMNSKQGQKSILCNYAAAKIQAQWKGWKARERLQQLIAGVTKQLQLVVRFQAVWRGYRTRKVFQLAIQDSKYEDFDDFEYSMVDENNYLSETFHLKELGSSKTDSVFHKTFDIHELPSHLLHYFDEAAASQTYGMQGDELFSRSDCKDDEKESEKHIQFQVEKKAAVAEITKDWGFSDEKTAWQLMRALANTRKQLKETPKTSSETRYNAFISKCIKNSRHLANPCLLASQCAGHGDVLDDTEKALIGNTKGGSRQRKRYVTASVTTLDFST